MKRWLGMMLVIALLLAGCTAGQGTTGVQLGSAPTVEDIFTAPPASSGTESTPSSPVMTAPEPSRPATTELGRMSFGMGGESQKDEMGHFYVYDGGQMYLPFSIKASDLMTTYDVGILIFVDGIAQPYRVGQDGEYAYMHTFSQKDGTQILGTTTTVADIYFTPITGKQGDTLEIYAISILNPSYLPSQGMLGFTHTDGSITCGSRLKYSATPPEETYPGKSTRLLEISTSVVDCTALDILDWSDTDLIEKMDYSFKVNGQTLYIYGVQEDEPVTLRYEVWGTPYVHYGLVFFVDGEPVYAADCADIQVTVEMGKKTIIEAKLDMTGFAGESVVYAILVPRNYRTSDIRTNAFLCVSNTIFLLEKNA